MSFTELAAVVTILGVFLTVYGLVNNRTLKQEARRITDLLTEESRNTRDILARIERGQEEARKEMAEAFRKMDEGHRETIKYLADLIRSEGDKTRQAIGGISG